ncbi:MAG TPA: hypothetical protein VEI54_06770 [Candidatus Limnocylindrales bacterium]|nr:hypothetical protein [Candidatus Limnocylindrales bacterium]
MSDPRSGIPSCIEHERLAVVDADLKVGATVRTRGRYLGRLRRLSRAELARLIDHDLEHGCSR